MSGQVLLTVGPYFRFKDSNPPFSPVWMSFPLPYPRLCSQFADATLRQNKPTQFSHPYCIQRSPLHHPAAPSPLFVQVPLLQMLPPPLPLQVDGDYSLTILPLALTLLLQHDV
jgi:hypothetical protein